MKTGFGKISTHLNIDLTFKQTSTQAKISNKSKQETKWVTTYQSYLNNLNQIHIKQR